VEKALTDGPRESAGEESILGRDKNSQERIFDEGRIFPEEVKTLGTQKESSAGRSGEEILNKGGTRGQLTINFQLGKGQPTGEETGAWDIKQPQEQPKPAPVPAQQKRAKGWRNDKDRGCCKTLNCTLLREGSGSSVLTQTTWARGTDDFACTKSRREGWVKRRNLWLTATSNIAK